MDKLTVQEQKQTIREQVKQARKRVTVANRLSWSNAANIHIIDWLREQTYTSILVYSALPLELNLTGTITWCWRNAINVYMPKTNPSEHTFTIYEVGSLDELQSGAMGIQEPYLQQRLANNVIPDVIIVPGVAFDRQGGRLGYGAGYYDRWIAANGQKHKPVIIGAAFEQQLVSHIPMEEHDFPMDMLVTEYKLYHLQSEKVY
ncbi:5-formyltetrahydrofolate cyclo-ligase [Paenibacillus yanchengensis]|uniref:5-formyltetrahydrofolate cyclo-ligase n=1 Tax=Paenibacillus yanchengensis TaxID=2035833 RepID=A0ABW4YGM8_9BACL